MMHVCRSDRMPPPCPGISTKPSYPIMNSPSETESPKDQSLRVVLRQIDAYNARDVDAFLALYAPDAEIIRLPDRKPCMSGRDEIRARYAQMFAESPGLLCKVESASGTDSYIALHERVSGMAGREEELDCLAIYQIENHLIRRLWLALG